MRVGSPFSCYANVFCAWSQTWAYNSLHAFGHDNIYHGFRRMLLLHNKSRRMSQFPRRSRRSDGSFLSTSTVSKQLGVIGSSPGRSTTSPCAVSLPDSRARQNELFSHVNAYPCGL